MAEVTIEMEEKLAQYINEKGFVEIFKRRVTGKCSEIAKCAIKNSNPDAAEKIADIAAQAIQKHALSNESVSSLKNELLSFMNPQDVRRTLKNLEKNQMQDSNILKIMSQNANEIFSSTSSIKEATWFNSALAVANLATSISSTVIFSKNLKKVNTKLDQVDRQLKSTDQKIDNLGNQIDHMGKQIDNMDGTLLKVKSDQAKMIHSHFVSDIKKPCRDINLKYASISESIGRGEVIQRQEVISFINDCVSQIETILEVEYDYSAWKLDMIGIISDILPAMTDMIVYFHKYYYDQKSAKGTLCETWMNIYDKLSNEKFLEDMRSILYLEKKLHNQQVQEITDCFYLFVNSLKDKVTQTIIEIEDCENPEKYREYDNFSQQYALQQAKAMESQMKKQFGDQTDELLAKAYELNMFADVM